MLMKFKILGEAGGSVYFRGDESRWNQKVMIDDD